MAFSVTYQDNQFKFSFSNRDLFFNTFQVHFQIQSINTNLVYVGDDLSNIVVNYTLCSSPTAASASLWIDAVKALIPASLSPIGTIMIDTNEPLVVTSSVSSATTMFTQNLYPDSVTTYRSCTVQITANASANTITFEASNDNTNWASTLGLLPIGGTNNFSTTTASTSGFFSIPLNTRYFRCRVSSYIGGTTTVVVCFSKDPPTNLQNLSALSAGSSNVGYVGIQYIQNNGGSATIRHIVSAASTNATNVKGATTRLAGWCLSNTNAAFRYVKLHNTSGVPTPGVGVVQTIGLPPNSTVTHNQEGTITFSTGLGYSIVTGAADSDATAVGLNDVVGDLFYV